MKEINGRVYPLWNQFEERKKEWIGGLLEDFGGNFDKKLNINSNTVTEITDITLEPNGETSAMFSVEGKDFSCRFDVQVGGIIGGEKNWITFQGYWGHIWRIKQEEKKE